MKRLGIFGGTFDPVHNEHIVLAKTAVTALNLDELIVMPAFMPPHKTSAPSPAADRLAMLRLAFGDEPKITVGDYELNKGGKSFTFETVEYYKSKINGELFFILGADMLTDFPTWKNPDRIVRAATVAAFGRDDFYADLKGSHDYFCKNFGKDFLPLSYSGKSASSTEIRIYNSLSLPIADKTAKSVAEYILNHNLYSGGAIEEFLKTNLTEKRLTHTANVAVCALSATKKLGLNSEKVKTAALLHDCAKYLSLESFKDLTLPDGVPAPVVHAFLGAYVAENVLGIKDAEIIDAIRFHTSGKADMSTLSKLIFVADMVEKDRTYEGVEKLRALFEKDFERCFYECLKEEVSHLIAKKSYIYKETLNAYDYYINNKKQ